MSKTDNKRTKMGRKQKRLVLKFHGYTASWQKIIREKNTERDRRDEDKIERRRTEGSKKERKKERVRRPWEGRQKIVL